MLKVIIMFFVLIIHAVSSSSSLTHDPFDPLPFLPPHRCRSLVWDQDRVMTNLEVSLCSLTSDWEADKPESPPAAIQAMLLGARKEDREVEGGWGRQWREGWEYSPVVTG